MHVHRALLEKPFPFLQSSPRNIVPHLFLMMLTFQSGDICVEEKVSADTELHIKSCMITARGETHRLKRNPGCCKWNLHLVALKAATK